MSVALVIGSAECLWPDVEAALQLGEYSAVISCNDATVVWRGQIDACCSYHPDKWPLWLERRRRAGLAPPARVFGNVAFVSSAHRTPDPRIEFVEPLLPGQVQTGSSGLFALKVALFDLGFDKAVLCGVPLDARPHFFDRIGWNDALTYRQALDEALPAIRARARSMSGRTAEQLGKPTADWLA